MADALRLREQFPFFEANPDIVYLDNSATSQVPASVIRHLIQFEAAERASPFRGMYKLSVQATDAYEAARAQVQAFIGAKSKREIIFTRNATESLNVSARMLEATAIKPGDEILVSILEHHSNLLPWQMAAERTGAKIRYLYCQDDGSIRPEDLDRSLTTRTRVLAITQMSNVFGRVNDLKTFCDIAHQNDSIVVADGCQSAPHIPVNVEDLGVDFFAFSGHKMLGPTGIGVLYVREALLEQLPPVLFGGEMVDSVDEFGQVWADLPHRFEAGTVNTGGAIALGEAVSFYNKIGFKAMMEREQALTMRLVFGMQKIPHIHIIGALQPEEHHGIVSFAVDGVHPHDVSTVLAESGIAIRAGYHCAQPLHAYMGLSGTGSCRASLMFYNTESEIDRFLEKLSEVRRMMGYGR